ncbi:MAG: hypothetical protein SPK09_02575 [Porphyromonas sp.]|nr:hypothetical protein [Porphyromonas sp.]
MKMMKYVLSLTCGLCLVACGGKDEPKTQTPLVENPQITKPNVEPNPKAKDEPTPPATPPPANEPPKATRPADHYMASRAVAEWSVEPAVYLQALDLDALLLDNQPAGIDIKTLAPYIKLSATTPEATERYSFTPEDIEQTSIRDLRYNSANRSLEFSLSYRSATSSERVRLPLNSNDYFAHKIRLRDDFAGERYLYGTAKWLALYAGDILDYDRNRYAVVIDTEVGLSKNVSSGELTFALKLYRANTDASYEIARVYKTLTGFRPLTALKQDLKLSSSHDLQQYFKQRLAKANIQGDADVTQRFSSSTELPWSKHLMLTIRGTQLVHQDRGTFVAEEHTPKYADLYFEQMRFTLHSARLQGRDLILELSISSINDYAVEGLRYTVSVIAVRD